MEENNYIHVVNEDDKKRQRIIKGAMAIIGILLILTIVFIAMYISSRKQTFINYNEQGNIDYKVYLKENSFFDSKYLSTDKKYIASLIDYINADFNYSIDTLEKTGSYLYSYSIDATVDVKDKNDQKVIYSDTKELVAEQNGKSNKNNNMNINESIKIDYNEYNDLIGRFVEVYDLDNVNSTLYVNLNLKVASTNAELKDAKSTTIETLEIPLTTKTVGIDMVTNVDNSNKLLIFEKQQKGNTKLIATAIAIFIIDMIAIAALIRYYLTTRTDTNVYEEKLNRILHSYKGYIQKVDISEFNYSDYQAIYVDSFNNLLEIRDTLQEPILMIENKTDEGNPQADFLIPSKTKIIYIYLFGVNANKKRLTAAQSVETGIDENEGEE